MQLSILTPTRGRPQAFKICERWMKRQTYRGPLEWIVAIDSDPLEYEFTMGQRVIQAPGGHEHSFTRNMRAALGAVTGDIVFFWEDDDWYFPGYLETLLSAFQDPGVDIAGVAPSVYYRVTDKLWRCMGNSKHCSLCQTAVRAKVIPQLIAYMDNGHILIDMKVWYQIGLCKRILPNQNEDGTYKQVAMKCLPGVAGISRGHKPGFNGRPDPEGRHLREMMGDDALVYREFMGVRA